MDLIIVKNSAIINTWGKVITDIPTIKNKKVEIFKSPVTIPM